MPLLTINPSKNLGELAGVTTAGRAGASPPAKKPHFWGGAEHQVLPRSRLLEPLMRSFFRVAALIAHFERRRVFRPIFAPIVQARRRDVGVAQPLLHLRDVGL